MVLPGIRGKGVGRFRRGEERPSNTCVIDLVAHGVTLSYWGSFEEHPADLASKCNETEDISSVSVPQLAEGTLT